MPILASNFVSNSLSGTVRVTNGFANITLATLPYALEGDKPFVIKIRKDSINGDVLATTPVLTFKDPSSFVSLTGNVSSVAEGNLVAFTLVTANAVNGANLFYSVFPVTANVTAGDFTGNTGSITITNNAATFALRANADVSLSNEDGETFRVQLRTNAFTGNVIFTTSNIVILDTYKTYNIISFNSNASPTVPRLSNVTFTLTATNIPNGTILYYNTTGNVASFFSNTGSFALNGISNSFIISTPEITANTEQIFNVVIRGESQSGPIVATSNTFLVYSPAIGQVEYTTPGTYSWTAPQGVTQVSVVCVGGGGGGGPGSFYSGGGGGGGLGWKNNITVIPGQTYTVVVGAAGGTGGDSYFIANDNNSYAAGKGGSVGVEGNAYGGSYYGDGGGDGGDGYTQYGMPGRYPYIGAYGGGGAGGYFPSPAPQSNPGAPMTRPGNSAGAATFGRPPADTSGSAAGGNQNNGGGGVGLQGRGQTGLYGGNGGSGGGGTPFYIGGSYGGGGSGSPSSRTSAGGPGAVRIIWGPNRAFPDTLTADQ